MNTPIKAYAVYHKNEEIRMDSSSGGVFSALAEYVLSQNGVVYGVTMSDDCYSAYFVSITDPSGLSRLRGSKYLQARVGDAYKRVKDDLLKGTLVLFTGVGCQINGLKKFLQRDFDHLICVDVICHGVPSPALWRKYVQYQEANYGAKLKIVKFRCKDVGWTQFGIKENQVYIAKSQNTYMQMFLRNYCLRPSCYECAAKSTKLSDMTIGDFWGIDQVAPEMNDEKGVSLVLLRSERGRQIFEMVSPGLSQKEVSYDEAVKGNPAEFSSVARPLERNTFFSDMRGLDFHGLEKKYAAPIKQPLFRRVKRKIASLLSVSPPLKKRNNTN